MAIYLSAGHSLHDTGAAGINGRTENKETIKLRNAVLYCLQAKGIPVQTDNDNESLAAYLARIHLAPGDKVLELHFDQFDGKASGTTAYVKNNAGGRCISFAQGLVSMVSQTLGIPSRGVKPESESGRRYLALVHASAMAVILEVCFIDNPFDMQAYDANFEKLCIRLAGILESV